MALLQQRVYALACVVMKTSMIHQQLRHDLAIQSAVEREEVLAGSSTLCCSENQSNRQTAWHIHQVMIDQFMTLFKQPPKEMLPDFDATDDAVQAKLA